MKVGVVVGMTFLILMAVAAGAAPGPQVHAVATESLSAATIAITPLVGYERAILRIGGPKGYQGRQRFESGETIQADLATFGRQISEQQRQRPESRGGNAERSVLPDGRYKFEVVFLASGRKVGVHSGMFFVEGGVAVSRESKRAQLAALRGELASDRRQVAARRAEAPMSFERDAASRGQDRDGGGMSVETATEGMAFADYLMVYPSLRPNYSWASLGNNPAPYSYQAWSMINSYGYLGFYFGGYPYPKEAIAGYPYPQITFTPAYGYYSAKVGIGTTTPFETLDINGSYSYGAQLGISGWGGYRSYVGVGGIGTWLYDSDYEPIVTFNHYADPFTLVVDAEGVGVGDFEYASPMQDLHVRAEDPQLLVESTSSTTTGRTVAFMKNNGDVRMFWQNTASGDVWQMSLLSTVLQMAAPSGNGKFRVRKSGGLQALNGSTTILDLDASGNLAVTTVTETSSREAKRGIEAVNGLSILDKVAALPIAEWSYKADNPSVRHLGPMAEDFHAAFGLGKSDKGLTSVDTSGVALAAIQGLNQKLMEKDARIAELELRLVELEQLVDRLVEP
jgi:hypothetical protein